jgi:hypothetical protein
VPAAAAFEPALVPAVDVDAGVLAVADRLGTVTLLSLAGGTRRWQRATRRPSTGGAAVLTPDAVVVRDEADELVVLDRRTGAIRARPWKPAALPEALAGDGRRVFVAWRAPGGSGEVAALMIGARGP